MTHFAARLLQPKPKSFPCADAEMMHFPAWGGSKDGLQKDFLLESASLLTDTISMLTIMIVFPSSFYHRGTFGRSMPNMALFSKGKLRCFPAKASMLRGKPTEFITGCWRERGVQILEVKHPKWNFLSATAVILL